MLQSSLRSQAVQHEGLHHLCDTSYHRPLLRAVPDGDVSFIGSDASATDPFVEENFMTQPQAGANGRQIHHARRRRLSESSSCISMAYQRPDQGSMQLRANQVGDLSLPSITCYHITKDQHNSLNPMPASVLSINQPSKIQAQFPFLVVLFVCRMPIPVGRYPLTLEVPE